MTERIKYIDAAKGFAILLMIFGHMKIHNLNWIIYSFHMPLFFILSGFFFNPIKSVSKRAKSLLIPYAYSALTIVFLEVIFQCFQIFTIDATFSITSIGWEIISAICGSAKPVGIGNYLIPDIGPIWFLMALALGNYMLHILKIIELKFNIQHGLILGCLILAILGWAISMARGQMPFSINQAFVVPLFLWFGGMLHRKNNIHSCNCNNNFIVVISFVLLWALLLFFNRNIQFMSMRQMESIYFPIYIMGSMSASAIIILVFQYIYTRKKMYALEVLGSATLLILCIHTIDLFGIEPRLHSYLLKSDFDNDKIHTIILVYKILIYLVLTIYIVITKHLHKSPFTIMIKKNRISAKIS